MVSNQAAVFFCENLGKKARVRVREKHLEKEFGERKPENSVLMEWKVGESIKSNLATPSAPVFK